VGGGDLTETLFTVAAQHSKLDGRSAAAEVTERLDSEPAVAPRIHGLEMEPLFVLILLPVLIGVGAEVLFRDTLRASLAAALLAPIVVFLSITTIDPGGTWNWLASLLVAPLAMALALAAVMVCIGRTHARKRPRRGDA
jgi:hypothetical protein